MVKKGEVNGGMLIRFNPEKIQGVSSFLELYDYTVRTLEEHSGNLTAILAPCVVQCHVRVHEDNMEQLAYQVEVLSAQGETVLDFASFHPVFSSVFQKNYTSPCFPTDLIHDFFIPLIERRRLFSKLFFTNDYQSSFSVEMAHDTAIRVGTPVHILPW